MSYFIILTRRKKLVKEIITSLEKKIPPLKHIYSSAENNSSSNKRKQDARSFNSASHMPRTETNLLYLRRGRWSWADCRQTAHREPVSFLRSVKSRDGWETGWPPRVWLPLPSSVGRVWSLILTFPFSKINFSRKPEVQSQATKGSLLVYGVITTKISLKVFWKNRDIW